MKRQLFILIFLISSSMYSSAQIMFQKTYGGADTEDGRFVQQTTDGGYIITGSTHSFGAGSGDVYLIKTDANGDTLWTKTFGAANFDELAFSVHQTTDGGYIIGGSIASISTLDLDVYLIKTDSNGNQLWSKTYGSIGFDYSKSAQQTTDGGYIMAGISYFGSGVGDVYLVKTDVNGDTLWSKTFGGTTRYEGYSVQQTTDGGYIIGSRIEIAAAVNYDVSLIKTDANGDTLWSKTFGGIDYDIGYSVQQTTDGGYIIAGVYGFGAVNNDVYLIKTDATGDTLWTKTFGGTGNDAAVSIQQTPDGGYIIAGYTYSFGAGNMDVLLIKTNPNGDTLWTKTYGGMGDDFGSFVQQTTDGGYVIGGRTESFGSGLEEIYLIKTDSLGNTGCNEGTTSIIIGTPATIVGNAATIVGSPNTIVTSPTTTVASGGIVTSICTCSADFSVYADTIPHNWIAVNLASGVAPLTFLWSWGDGNTSSGATPSHIYNTPGYYNICLTITDAAGCTSTYCDSSTYIFRGNSNNAVITINVILTTSIIEQTANNYGVIVYPNPANDIITINSTINFPATEIILYDASGRAVMEKKLNNEASFSVKQLNAGIYFYKIKDAKGNEARGKVVKE